MKKWISTFVFLLSAVFSQAQETTLRASADKTTVGEKEVVEISFTVNGEGSDFVPPSNLEEHFYIISGPFRSSRMYSFNGQGSQENTWSFRAQPKRVGTFRLESASVTVDRSTIRSNKLEFRVTEQADDQESNDPRVYAAQQTYMRVIPSKIQVYEGEPFGVTYRLFAYVSPGRPEILEIPDYEGFFKENLEISPTQKKEVDDDGKELSSWDWAGYALIPQRAGTFEFEPLVTRIPTPVPTRRRNIFGQMVATNVYVDNIDKAYHPDIEVLPLPLQGRPENFSGGVGDLKFQVELSRDEIEANQSVTLRLKISGKGNLNTLQIPDAQLPDQLELFEPADERSVVPSPSGLRGTIIREYIIVPRYRGTYKIPPMEFVYFDPDKEGYVTVRSEEKSITVTGGLAQAPTTTNPESAESTKSVERESVDYLSEEIRWIHTQSGGMTSARPFYTRWWFFGGTSASFALAAFVLFAGRIRNWSESRKDAISRAAEVALKGLRTSNGANETENIFSQFLSSAYQVSRSKQVDGILQRELMGKGLDEGSAQAAYQLLARCEEVQFGGRTGTEEEVKREVERWIKDQAK